MANYDTTILADTPVGFWKLNEANGASTVADSSGGGFTGTNHGTFGSDLGTLDVPAGMTAGDTCFLGAGEGAGNCYSLVTPSGTLLASLQNHDFSNEIWMKPQSGQSGQQAWGSFGNGSTDALLQLQTNGGNLFMGFTFDDWSAHATPSNGVWHQVVFTWTQSTKGGILYIDGANVATHTYGGNLSVSSTGWGLCGSPTAVWGTYLGRLSRFSMYNYVLTSGQVSTHYTAGSTGPPPPPLQPRSNIAVQHAATW